MLVGQAGKGTGQPINTIKGDEEWVSGSSPRPAGRPGQARPGQARPDQAYKRM